MNGTIFCGIPSVDGKINNYLVTFLMNNSDKLNGICIKTGQPTDCNRNFIVNEFLKSKCDWLFMIDDDMVPPADLLNIINDLKEDIDIISPINYIYQNGMVINNLFGKIIEGKKGESIIKIDSCGCGCVFIHKNVFSHMLLKQPYFEFLKNDKGELWMSENINFTNKCKDLGIFCYINMNYETNHLKTVGLRDML